MLPQFFEAQLTWRNWFGVEFNRREIKAQGGKPQSRFADVKAGQLPIKDFADFLRSRSFAGCRPSFAVEPAESKNQKYAGPARGVEHPALVCVGQRIKNFIHNGRSDMSWRVVNAHFF